MENAIDILSKGYKNSIMASDTALHFGNYQIALENISYMEADINYTVFHKRDGRPYVSSKTMKYFESLLADKNFVRIHRSHIVNLSYIEDFIINIRNAELKLKCGKHIEISRRKYKIFSKNNMLTKLMANN